LYVNFIDTTFTAPYFALYCYHFTYVYLKNCTVQTAGAMPAHMALVLLRSTHFSAEDTIFIQGSPSDTVSNTSTMIMTNAEDNFQLILSRCKFYIYNCSNTSAIKNYCVVIETASAYQQQITDCTFIPMYGPEYDSKTTTYIVYGYTMPDTVFQRNFSVRNRFVDIRNNPNNHHWYYANNYGLVPVIQYAFNHVALTVVS
jgi:hypothetical protein